MIQRANHADLESGATISEAPLSRLRPGSRGRVARVVGDAGQSLRLKSLGFCQGHEVEVLRTGDAWVVRVVGSRIGLSRRLADQVLLMAV